MQADRNIARISSKQYGVFSRDQATSAGFSPSAIVRRLRNGEWLHVFPGVYRLSSVPRSWKQDVMAALLWAGEGSVASHRTAAALLGLGEIAPGVLEISLSKSRRPIRGIALHRTGEIPSCDHAKLDRLRITTVARTLVDLGAVVDDDTLEVAVEDVLRRRLTSVEQLQRRLKQLAAKGRPGPLALRRVLAKRYPGNWISGSTLEVKVMQAMRRHGVPPAVPQFQVKDGDREVARVDFAYPDVMLAIECESYEHHSEREDWVRDVRRYNELVSIGWGVICATSEDIANPSRLIREISARTESLSDTKRAKKASVL
jgi:hypothetical protein